MKINKKESYNEAYPRNYNGPIRTNLDKAHSPFKVLAHPQLIRKYTCGEKVAPIHIRVGLTNRCNLRCNFCNFHSPNEKSFYNAFNYNDMLGTEKVIKFLQDFSENGGKAVTFCGSGECTIHPGYEEICYSAQKFGLKIGLITNGTMLDKAEMLECVIKTHTWVRVGLNAGSSETYSQVVNYKESAFNSILESVKYLRSNAEEKEFKVGLNFVITLQNCHEIVDAVKAAQKANADYIRFEPEFYSSLAHETIYEKISDINQQLETAKSMSSEEFEVSIPKLDRGPMANTDKIEGDFQKCHYCNFVTALGADGYMYPCPQIHLNIKYRMGNAIENGYSSYIKSGEKEKWLSENCARTQNCKTCFYRPQNELLEWLSDGRLDVDDVLNQYNRDYPETLHKFFV